MGKPLALVFVTGLVLAFLGASPAAASHGKGCGVVSKGSGDYSVRARVMSCRSARKWVRSYLRNGARPSGFSCVDPAGSIRVYCSRGSKSYWATRL